MSGLKNLEDLRLCDNNELSVIDPFALAKPDNEPGANIWPPLRKVIFKMFYVRLLLSICGYMIYLKLLILEYLMVEVSTLWYSIMIMVNRMYIMCYKVIYNVIWKGEINLIKYKFTHIFANNWWTFKKRAQENLYRILY